MRRMVVVVPLALLISQAPPLGAAAAKPAKAKVAKVAVFSAGPFRPFKKFLKEDLRIVKEHLDTLKGPHQDAWTALVRGLSRIFFAAIKAVHKAGKTGLGAGAFLWNVARRVLASVAERKMQFGKGLVKWVFGRIRSVLVRLRHVLKKTGLKDPGFVPAFWKAAKNLAKAVLLIAKGKAEWSMGTTRKIVAGLGGKLAAAFAKLGAGLRRAQAKAKKAWDGVFKDFIQQLSESTDELFGRFGNEFSPVSKTLLGWWKKLQGAAADGYRALLQGLAALGSRAKGAGDLVASNFTQLVVTGLARAAKKGLGLGQGLGKYILALLGRWQAMWKKVLPAGKVNTALFEYLTEQARSLIGKAGEVQAGKAKLGMETVGSWLEGAAKKLASIIKTPVTVKGLPKALLEKGSKVVESFFK